MKVFHGIESVSGLRKPVVAIGSFDGVHLGHVRILQHLHDTAKTLDGESVVITFDPHPQVALHPGNGFFVINTLEENIRHIEAQGIDAVVIIPFTKAFSQLSYAEFLETVIVGKLKASALVMGPDHTLGHNREGNHSCIEQLCSQNNVQVVMLPELLLHEVGVRSTKIRNAISEKRWQDVDEMLGYHYEASTL